MLLISFSILYFANTAMLTASKNKVAKRSETKKKIESIYHNLRKHENQPKKNYESVKSICTSLQKSLNDFVYDLIPWNRIYEWIEQKTREDANYFNAFLDNDMENINQSIYDEFNDLLMNPLTNEYKIKKENIVIEEIKKLYFDMIVYNVYFVAFMKQHQKAVNTNNIQELIKNANKIHDETKKMVINALYILNLKKESKLLIENFGIFYMKCLEELEKNKNKDKIYAQILMLYNKYHQNTLSEFLLDPKQMIANLSEIIELIDFLCQQVVSNFGITTKDMIKMLNITSNLLYIPNINGSMQVYLQDMIRDNICKYGVNIDAFIPKYISEKTFFTVIKYNIIQLYGRTFTLKDLTVANTCKDIFQNTEILTMYSDNFCLGSALIEEFANYKKICEKDATGMQEKSVQEQTLQIIEDFCKIYPILCMTLKAQRTATKQLKQMCVEIALQSYKKNNDQVTANHRCEISCENVNNDKFGDYAEHLGDLIQTMMFYAYYYCNTIENKAK